MSAGTDSIDYRYLLKLSGTSVILQILGWTVSTFPFFMFFAYVPLIALCFYLNRIKNRISGDLVITIVASFLLPALFKFLIFKPSLRDFVASLSPIVVFLLWFFSGMKIGTLKSFYLVIFWLGIEYIFIFIKPAVFNHLPGAAFRLWGESIVYIRYTGFQGTTLWILLTNILFTQSFFDREGKVVPKFSRMPFLVSSLTGVLPMVISMLMYDGNPAGDLTEFFSNPAAYQINFNFSHFYSYYLDYGEYLGKTSFWLCFLILLSLFIKGFISRK